MMSVITASGIAVVITPVRATVVRYNYRRNCSEKNVRSGGLKVGFEPQAYAYAYATGVTTL